MRRKLRTAGRLSGSDLRTVAEAWVLLLFTEVALRVLPFPRVSALLTPRARDGDAARDPGPGAAAPAATAADDPVLSEALRLQRLVDIAARNHLIPMLCLRRSLVLRWILGRRGIPATLRFGVPVDGEGPLAHAWVECRGYPIGEKRDLRSRYAPFTETGERGAAVPKGRDTVDRLDAR